MKTHFRIVYGDLGGFKFWGPLCGIEAKTNDITMARVWRNVTCGNCIRQKNS